MSHFDRYVIVDWSAASRPVSGDNSIWVAILDGGDAPVLLNPTTRAAAAAALEGAQAPERRTLLAVDASLGYPAGTAAWFGLDDVPPWRAMWNVVSDLLIDRADNRNNRFEVAAALNRKGGDADGPFWGRPGAREIAGLSATKPPTFPVEEFRRCERSLRERGLRPASCWQLLGAGSVGSQTLTLLPLLARLVDRGRIDIWPFTTGPTPQPVATGEMLVAEIWPTMFDVDAPVGVVRDAAQVAAVASALRDADRHDRLLEWFGIDQTGADLAAVVGEEGWILGPTPIGVGSVRNCARGRLRTTGAT